MRARGSVFLAPGGVAPGPARRFVEGAGLTASGGRSTATPRTRVSSRTTPRIPTGRRRRRAMRSTWRTSAQAQALSLSAGSVATVKPSRPAGNTRTVCSSTTKPGRERISTAGKASCERWAVTYGAR